MNRRSMFRAFVAAVVKAAPVVRPELTYCELNDYIDETLRCWKKIRVAAVASMAGVSMVPRIRRASDRAIDIRDFTSYCRAMEKRDIYEAWHREVVPGGPWRGLVMAKPDDPAIRERFMPV